MPSAEDHRAFQASAFHYFRAFRVVSSDLFGLVLEMCPSDLLNDIGSNTGICLHDN